MIVPPGARYRVKGLQHLYQRPQIDIGGYAWKHQSRSATSHGEIVPGLAVHSTPHCVRGDSDGLSINIYTYGALPSQLQGCKS